MLAAVVFGLPAAVVIAGCTPSPAEMNRFVLPAMLEASRAKWRKQQIDSYEYTYRVGCFCPQEITQPFVVTVVDGEVAGVRRAGDGVGLAAEDMSRYRTIDQLFDSLESALSRGYDGFGVQFDPQLGYPTYWWTDPRFNTADDENTYTIDALTPL